MNVKSQLQAEMERREEIWEGVGGCNIEFGH